MEILLWALAFAAAFAAGFKVADWLHNLDIEI